MTETDPSTLPQWKGQPVPWVARWTGEITDEPYGVQVVKHKEGGYNFKVAYERGHEIREKSGILWQREAITRSGEPKFGDVNTFRQRTSMTKRLCQICGTKIESDLTPWIIEPLELAAEDARRLQQMDDYHITTTPPVCNDCIPLALRLCPHLSRYGAQILDVAEYEIWGVFGEAVYVDGETGAPVRTQTSIGYHEDYGDAFSYEGVLAKQQIAKLTKFTVREIIAKEKP